jgi:hypothetical protein
MRSAPNRFGLSILMGFISFLAVGLGAMRNGTWLAMRLSLVVTLVALLVGLLGAIVRRGEGAWVGFALFGCFALGLAFMPSIGGNPNLPLDPAVELVDWLADELYPQRIETEPAFPELNPQFMQWAQIMPRTQLESHSTARALLTPAEMEKYDDFIIRSHAFEDSFLRYRERRLYAGYIGHCWLALVFALLGALMGRTLERSRQPNPAVRPLEG